MDNTCARHQGQRDRHEQVQHHICASSTGHNCHAVLLLLVVVVVVVVSVPCQ
jgi:hypothetical protein